MRFLEIAQSHPVLTEDGVMLFEAVAKAPIPVVMKDTDDLNKKGEIDMCEAIQGMIDDAVKEAVNDTLAILMELKNGTPEDMICAKLKVPMERIHEVKEFLRNY